MVGPLTAYEGVLWLCYVITHSKGLCLETFGEALTSSMVVNVADVFESYMRELTRVHSDEILEGCKVLDGNRRPIPLFTENDDFSVHPDVYVLDGPSAVVVLDVKYKPATKAGDRYEILAFCDALVCDTAVFLMPCTTEKIGLRKMGTTPRGVAVFELRFDLAADDIAMEEQLFIHRLSTLLSSTSGATRLTAA